MHSAPALGELEKVDDALVAERAAAAAGDALLTLRTSLDRDNLGARADRDSHDILHRTIGRLCPADWILSEEADDTADRLTRDRVWIIDPLDGTREYGEEGRTDWAVHVALVSEGKLAVGVVALPALGLVLSSARPPRLRDRSGRLRMVVSRSRPPEIATGVSHRLGAVMTPMGSAGAKAMSILLGWSDVYIHAGGQYEWDSAAPVAVALAAGLHASRLDGSPLVYNRYPAWLPDLVICRRELAPQVLEAVHAVSA